MATFFVLIILIALFFSLLIILFINRSNTSFSVTEVNNNIFKHQFEEIEEDFKMGVISKKEFDSIQNELSKRVLKYTSNKISDQQNESKVLNNSIKVISIPLILLFSILFYYYNGQPGLPDLPLSERKDNIVPIIFFDRALIDIDKRISVSKDSIELYILKANTLSALNQTEQAIKIWKFIIDNFNEKLDAEIYLSFGETIVQNIVNQEGKILITKEAKDIFEKASKLSTLETEEGALTRFYLGLYDYQNGKIESAKKVWDEIIISSPDNSLWKKQIELHVNQIFENQADKENEKILSMVSRLSKRLYDTNSTNINEWNKLGRSYVVLGQFEESIKAYQKAYNLDTENLASLKGLAESMLLNNKTDQPVEEKIINLFENILLKDVNYPLALWVIAENEILSNNFIKAEQLLNRILIQLSEGTEEYNLVLRKLKELNN
jgi:cytochrome c-type biogenesis protein CcmH